MKVIAETNKVEQSLTQRFLQNTSTQEDAFFISKPELLV